MNNKLLFLTIFSLVLTTSLLHCSSKPFTPETEAILVAKLKIIESLVPEAGKGPYNNSAIIQVIQTFKEVEKELQKDPQQYKTYQSVKSQRKKLEHANNLKNPYSCCTIS